MTPAPGTAEEIVEAASVDGIYNRFIDGLPGELLELEDLELLNRLHRPTLVRVAGARGGPSRAVATLLHGNEDTGFRATLSLLRRPHRQPGDLWVLWGNVAAAQADGGFAARYLDEQEDFNRIWGLGEPTTQQRRAADGILSDLVDANLESLIDIHNNSGNNPFYAIVTETNVRTLNLATIFTTTLLHWELNAHTLMEALRDASQTAAIAVECGLAGRPESLAFAIDGIRRYLGAPALAEDDLQRDYDLLGNIRKVVVRPEVVFSFGGTLTDDLDLVLDGEGDVNNFVEVPAGHVLGHIHEGALNPIVATDASGADVTERFFAVDGNRLTTTTPVTPVMMTRTVEAARKDCLFYLAGDVSRR